LPEENTLALWQFKLLLTPTVLVTRTDGCLEELLSDSQSEAVSCWPDIQPVPGFAKWIDALLPKAETWSDEIDFWGDKEGNRAAVCYTDSQKATVELIEFEVDVRDVSPTFVKGVCSLARALSCIFLVGKERVCVPNRVIEPNEQAVAEAIESSFARRYLDDPISALQSLKGNEVK
jgi:hypothetical protein